MCGEYGDRTSRPHYHAIIFKQDFTEDREKFKKTDEGNQLFTSPILDEAWNLGIHTIGAVSFDTCAYVASYVQKRIKGDKAKEHYRKINKETGEEYNQEPEFALMSRNKGLGNSWIKRWHQNVYPRDEIRMNGHLMTPPAYYDRWLSANHPSTWEQVKLKRLEKAKEWAHDNTPERLKAKEKLFKKKYGRYLARKKGQINGNP